VNKSFKEKMSKICLATFTYTQSDFNILAPNPNINTADPKQMTVNIINYLLFFLGVIAVVAIVYAGILFLVSGGEAERTARARSTFLYAIIGIIIIVLAFAIVRWVANSFAPNIP
jgi:cytochrome bd-type quinol oxidase subunit 2